MKFFGTKTNKAGATVVVLLLTLPLLTGVMQGTAGAKGLPYLAVLAADQERMVGHGRGVLVAQDGCVVLRDGLGKPTLVVFPTGYSVVGGQKKKVLSDRGVKVAVLGRTVTLDGGYAGQYQNDEAALDALLVAPVPDKCTYGYVFFGY